MTVKTPGSQMGFPAAAEEGGEAMGGGRGKSGESSEVHERLSVTPTAPKARSRSRGVATLDEAPSEGVQEILSFRFGGTNLLNNRNTTPI